MAAPPGWYPDPAGVPGRFRYWDGQQWSDDTRGGEPPRRRRPGLILGALALLVVLVVAVAFAVRAINGRTSGLIDDPAPPESSVSGWDDSSPLPTASPTPTGDPQDSAAPQGTVACAHGDPWDHQPHPADGRIHGGRLSFVQPGGDWRRDDEYADGLSYAYDVSGASEKVEEWWWAMLAVGELHSADGFRTPRQAADGVMQCIASSYYYTYFTGRKDVYSKRFSLDGHSGWALRSTITVDDPKVKASGDVVEVIVLDTGDKGRLSLFAGFVPIGDQGRIGVLDQAIGSLRVD